MTHPSPITAWLDHLQALLPPSAITLVGAGKGSSTWAQWLAQQNLAAMTLVEANPQEFAALQRQQAAGQWAGAALLNTVVAPSAGEAEFFTASLAAESGLLPAQSLRNLWPNLQNVATQILPATALTALVETTPEQGQQWLLLDCLPAATLLGSIQAVLSKLDVVLARVLLVADEPPAHWPQGASLAEVAQALPGFTQVALEPSRHPFIAHALWVRDYRSASHSAHQAQQAEAKAKQVAQQAQTELQAKLDGVQAEKAELLKKQELQAQSSQVLQADLTKTTQAKDAEAKAKQAAEQANTQLQAQYEKLQAEQQETTHRQQLLEEEMRKAEVQLELLKELLLRDETTSEPSEKNA